MADELLNDRPKLAVLLIEDSQDDCDLNLLELRRGGFDVTSACADNRDDTRALLTERQWDVVLSDHAMPGFSSGEVLELIDEFHEGTPCIIVSGAIGEDAAVELLQSGAVDYINKGKLHRLVPAIRRALEEADGRRARRAAEDALRESERKLRELNEHLEQRVQERTAEVLAQSRLIETALNTLKDVFYVIDTDLRLIRWNHELRSVSGLTDAQIEGRRLSAFMDPSDTESLEAWAGQVWQRGSATAELRIRTGENTYTPYEFTGATLRGADGESEGLCGIAHNIATRRQTEYQLKEAIRAVIDDATWFAQSVLEKMNQVAPNGEATPPHVDLTERELEVLEKMATGLKNEQIAAELGITYATVRNYVARIYDKLDVHSRAEAVIWARERGFGQSDSLVLT